MIPHPPAIVLPLGEAREIAYRFTKDWSEYLDATSHVGACMRVEPNVARCPAYTTGYAHCKFTVYVRKSGPHVYFGWFRNVRCEP